MKICLTSANVRYVWPYFRNMVLFFLVTPPAMILVATVSQLAGLYRPTFDLLISEIRQVYFVSAFVGPVISFIHTFVLRNEHSRRSSMLRSAWYAIVLACVGTLSLFHLFVFGFDLIIYLIPGCFFYGLVTGKLDVNAADESSPVWALRKVSFWHYLLNVCLFVLITVVIISLGLWIALKSGIIEGGFVTAPIFLFIVTIFLSIVHTYLLQEVSGTSNEVFQRRSIGMAASLALLVCAVYLFYRRSEFFLFFAAAVIYGWLISRVTGRNRAVAHDETAS